MGNKKVVIFILGFLFVVSFSMGIIGLVNKNRNNAISDNNSSNNNEQVPNNTSTNYISIDYQGNTLEVEKLDEVVSNYEFIKANKESKNNGASAKIENGQVNVEIKKESINDPDESDPELLTMYFDHIASPVGVLIYMSDDEGNPIRVYVVNNSNELFCMSFNASPRYDVGISTYKYNIPNFSSFYVTKKPLGGEHIGYYAIIKTNDNKYYTDYDFGAGGVIITQLINKEVTQ